MSSSKKKIKDYSLAIGIISLLVVIILWVINWKVLNDYKPDVRGTHGDMFGAVNAIFSGLAFSGIILSLYMQRIELKIQRKELKLTRKEVKRTNREFRLQNQTMETQKFENQYYKMIDLHKDNVNEIIIPFFDLLDGSISNRDNKRIETNSSNSIIREVVGKKGFVDMFKELEFCLKETTNTLERFGYKTNDLHHFSYAIFFWGVYSEFSTSKKIKLEHQTVIKNRIKLKQKQYKKNLTEGRRQEINTRYVPFQGHESRLAHYYRHLFQTVKYVVNQEEKKLIPYDETRQYLRVLRAQLSNAEQLMLYYNYICGFGQNWDRLGEKGYSFLTKYRMIHNIPIDRVKIVENPRLHFRGYISEIEDTGETLFEWGDS